MAFKRPKARILERTITSGSGPLTVAGAVDGSYNTFASFMAVGDTTFATVVEPGVAFWTGIVTYSATNQITLTTIEESKGTFGSGTKEVFAGTLAARSAIPDDSCGAIATTGTSSAYAVTSFRTYDTLARLNGNLIAFTPHASNANTLGNDVTLSVDGLAAKPIRSQSGVQLPNGSLIAGTPYLTLYNNTDGVFYLHNMTNPYNIPLGSGIDHWGPTAPNSSFILAQGQAISRVTFVQLWNIYGTTYGSGNGSTTFNVPDVVGRVRAMRDIGSARISTAFSGGNPALLGSSGGSEGHTLTSAQHAAHTHANTASQASHFHDSFANHTARAATLSATGPGPILGVQLNNSDDGNMITDSLAPTITVANASSGSGSAHNNMPPYICCDHYIRAL